MPRPLGWLAGAEWTVIRTEEVSRSVAHPACAVLQHSGAASAKVATDADANLAVATDMLVGGVLLPRFRHEESGRPSAREDGVGFTKDLKFGEDARNFCTLLRNNGNFYHAVDNSALQVLQVHGTGPLSSRPPHWCVLMRGLITNTVPGYTGSRCTLLPKQCRPASPSSHWERRRL